jgi:hypothetical protein
MRLRTAAVLVLSGVVTLSCDRATPTQPSPPPPLPPALAPGLADYHLSGVVTDDEGAPRANVNVHLTYLESLERFAIYSNVQTRTDGQGFYMLDFKAVPLPGARPAGLLNAIAFASARDDAGGYEGDHQYITATTSSISKNFRVSRFKRVTAGGEMPLTIRPDSPICNNDTQDMHPWPTEWVCGIVRVVAPADGMLSVTAVAVDGGSAPSLLQPNAPFDFDFNGTPVKAGSETVICVELPWPVRAARSFVVKTSLKVS